MEFVSFKHMVQIKKSTRPISAAEIKRGWHIFDMAGKTLGRVVPEIATLLQGKHKVAYAPYLDTGDHVVVINAEKVQVTGKKTDQKEYEKFSGYPGGLKTLTFKQMMERRPEDVVRYAVSGMLPKNKHRDQRLARLHIYKGEHHPYSEKFEASNQS